MRLQPYEVDCIRSITNKIFGKGTKVILFGSRVDDELKGGDIDLYIQPMHPNALTEKKIDFLVALKSKIGDQKIDVVISKDRSRFIEQEALKKGIEIL
jgi:predicted nucleotidyltransferase